MQLRDVRGLPALMVWEVEEENPGDPRRAVELDERLRRVARRRLARARLDECVARRCHVPAVLGAGRAGMVRELDDHRRARGIPDREVNVVVVVLGLVAELHHRARLAWRDRVKAGPDPVDAALFLLACGAGLGRTLEWPIRFTVESIPCPKATFTASSSSSCF